MISFKFLVFVLSVSCAIASKFHGSSNNSYLQFLYFLETDYEFCSDPDNYDGFCVPLQECADVVAMAKVKPMSQQTKLFLKKSICKMVDKKPWVCCASVNRDTTTKKATVTPQKLKATPSNDPIDKELNRLQKLCGKSGEHAEEGETTLIGEFPWNVILKYTKRKS